MEGSMLHSQGWEATPERPNLTQALWQLLPCLYLIGPAAEKECSICLERFRDSRVTVLPCVHIFHRECAKEWLKDHVTCPICRQDVPCNLIRSGIPRETPSPPRPGTTRLRRISDASAPWAFSQGNGAQTTRPATISLPVENGDSRRELGYQTVRQSTRRTNSPHVVQQRVSAQSRTDWRQSVEVLRTNYQRRPSRTVSFAPMPSAPEPLARSVRVQPLALQPVSSRGERVSVPRLDPSYPILSSHTGMPVPHIQPNSYLPADPTALQRVNRIARMVASVFRGGNS